MTADAIQAENGLTLDLKTKNLQGTPKKLKQKKINTTIA
jgi:hypothetical protein